MTSPGHRPVIGWREWLSLPELGIAHIKAKVDTGARTSALHTFELEPYQDQDIAMVRFLVHPWQDRDDVIIECHAPILEQRWVTDSGGHREQRFVIVSPLQLGDQSWPVELTLTNRDSMKFRMLLGRTAMRRRFVVDPALSYQLGTPPEQP